MKELSIEEKAKAYDEAIERAKQWRNAPNVDKIPTFGNRIIEEIFPELKESEDELTWLKKYIEEEAYSLSIDIRDDEDRIKLKKLQNALSWLEKQGEQKVPVADFKAKDWYVSRVDGKIHNTYHSVDKVEPKFKVGDWILYSGDHYEGVRHITKINENGYYIERNGLPHGIIPFNHEVCMRLWTIADAKDGDVLHSPSHHLIWIYKDEEHYHACVNMNYVTENVATDGLISFPNDTCPANKVQRSILFQKMEESNYKWDAEKKELKKIKQKNAWSEEDSPYYDDICEILINLLHSETTKVNKDIIQKDLNWLVSIKNRVIPQPKQEWSEEDVRNIQDIDSVLFYDKSLSEDTCMRLRNWLESLRPQNRWKPSDEQLNALHDAAVYIDKSMFPYPKGILMKLYKHLKKLREE